MAIIALIEMNQILEYFIFAAVMWVCCVLFYFQTRNYKYRKNEEIVEVGEDGRNDIVMETIDNEKTVDSEFDEEAKLVE